jgi:hypothetical protein
MLLGHISDISAIIGRDKKILDGDKIYTKLDANNQ